MFIKPELFHDTVDNPTPIYLVMMFILGPLVYNRQIKPRTNAVRQKISRGMKRTMSRSMNSIVWSAKKVTTSGLRVGKTLVKKPKGLIKIKKPKAPSRVSLYKLLPLKLVSRVFGWLSRLYLPVWLRPLCFKFYIKLFKCRTEEMFNEDLTSYKTISEFFRRKIKLNLRPLDTNAPIISPCDGKVLTCGRVSSGLIEQVKGITYTAQTFLGSPLTKDDHTPHTYAESLLKYHGHALHYCVIYLAPGDYHRFHSPTEWQISWRRHYVGHLFSVNPYVASWLQDLFCLNERAAYYGSWTHGFFSMTAVGATIVGCINVHFDPELKTNKRLSRLELERRFQTSENSNGILLSRGDNFGDFDFGSTIVLVFEAPDNLVFNVKPGCHIRLGEPLCFFDKNLKIIDNLTSGLSAGTTEVSTSEYEDEQEENDVMKKDVNIAVATKEDLDVAAQAVESAE
ncbi:unnamed protein product [Didymodactylos carnosus]|uniref:Phosphatidylserine decarboxylase proenzyme, mitochondrial n=1 Tax=Didymodactylos carnosus TaxID=1234261 RepID=A0A813WWM5_9BILA|nr:unnamed protein product [Didymodactylos carnosus]CAF1198016.1 unnamed protein product [Didymodactylos carnosus]CAF3649252.1 unnamed protein product [Didymodactylos carnosus]CAF4008257.1 unnamed protein product [Didymodactylos carnosus]